MKTKLLLLFIFFSSICSSQIITIPDVNFKNALLNTLCVDADLDGVYESTADLNNDGQIQFSEASAVIRLNISNNSISNLSGLQFFSNLKILICNDNSLTQFSIATSSFALTNLEYIDCSNNAITSLDLYVNSSPLTNLNYLNCSNNQISTIDLAYTSLVELNISNNNIASYNQLFTNPESLVDLNISGNQFASFTVNHPNLTNFSCFDNPLTALTFNRFSNTPLVISDLDSVETIYLSTQIAIPSLTLTNLPNLNYLRVELSTIDNTVVLSDLPSLNAIVFRGSENSLTLGDNLGFTELNSGFAQANTIDLSVVNFRIENNQAITQINLNNHDIQNFSLDNMPSLSSLKIHNGILFETLSLNNLPQLDLLEIGSPSSNGNFNCFDLTIQNLESLTTLWIRRIKLNTLVVDSLPSLVNFTNEGDSCSNTNSTLTLSNLPLLNDVRQVDLNLSSLYIENLDSLYDLEITSTKLGVLELNDLPELYNFKYTSGMGSSSVALPMLTLNDLPSLHTVFLSRLNNGGLNLNNLPSLYSLTVTNEYISTTYVPQVFNYTISDLPSLYYVQLDQIRTDNLSFSNVPNLNTLKMRSSIIGSSYTFDNLSLETLEIDKMSSLNNLSFNNLPNFKNLSLLDTPNLLSFNFGNTNTSLETFEISSNTAISTNAISSLDFTDFPQLTYLKVNYRLANITFENLPNLTFLNCSSNRLNSLTLEDQLPSLNEIIFNFNQPTNTSTSYKIPLNLNLPQLTKLNVNYNNNRLADLDLSNCPSLNELHYILYNSTMTGTIPYINLKNGNSDFILFESSPINVICVDDETEKDLLQSLNAELENTVFTSYCNFNPGGTFYTIQGNSLLDLESDGCDASDIVFPMINLMVETGGITSNYFADNSGNYSIPLIEGEYTITPVFENSAYYNFSPSSFNVEFPAQTSPVIQNFCITPNGDHNDLEIVILPLTIAQPGFNAHYKIIYKNKGNLTQSGTVSLSFDDLVMDYFSSIPAFSNLETSLLSWNYANLLPFESREIEVMFNLNTPTETPPLNSDDILNYTATIDGLDDETPNDNEHILNHTVVNSYDPNDKTCLEGTTILPTKVGEYVHYLIRFENNGTSNAQHIVVKDIIDTNKFDITTLLPIDASHSFETRILKINEVEFIFQNINLPFDDANNDGYVLFKIKTKSNLVIGDTFNNLANIYFDYNSPIITNEYSTIVQNTLGLIENTINNEMIFYPNPVKDVLHFKSIENILKIEVYDIIGRIISSNSVQDNQVNLTNLNKGNYLIKIFTEKGVMNTKIIKE